MPARADVPSPSSHTRADPRRIPAIDNLLGNVGEGLVPIRIEPPQPHEGLRNVSFTEGLDELTVDALRGNMTKPAEIGRQTDLAMARRRASEMFLRE